MHGEECKETGLFHMNTTANRIKEEFYKCGSESREVEGSNMGATAATTLVNCWNQMCIMNCLNCDKQIQLWRCTVDRILRCYRFIYSHLSLVVPPSPPVDASWGGRLCVLRERGK